jgi:hypothetical protein
MDRFQYNWNMEYLLMKQASILWLLIVVLALSGCAAPQPALYPNGYYRTVGEQKAQQDIDECIMLADKAGTDGEKGLEIAETTGKSAAIGGAAGAVSGAISDSIGRGSLIGVAVGGTVGFLGGLFRAAEPSQLYMRFVEYCLMEKGYQPVGWR